MPLEIDSIIVENPTLFFQTIQDNASETSLPTVDVYESIVGNRTEVLLSNFVVVGTSLKYIGENPIKLMFNCAVAWEAGGTLNARYKIALFKNGTSSGKVEGTLDNSNAWPRNVSLNGIVDLIEDDILDLKVSNESNTQSVLIIDLLFNGSSI